MRKANYLALLVGMSSILPSIHDAIAQSAVCTTMATMPNNGWVMGNFISLTDTISLDQNSAGHISGTYTTSGGTCGGLHFSVSGTYQGNGNFTFTASNPSSVVACGTQFDFYGTIAGVGCNTFTAAVHTYPQGENTTGYFAHSCYAPTTETQPTLLGWGYQGTPRTLATVQQSVVPSSYDWGGRTIYETSPVNGTDSCWFANNDGVMPFTTVTGGGVTIPSGSYYKDQIGGTEAIVWYYRAHNKAPCGSRVTQALWIQCDAGNSTDVNYLTYTDQFGIGTTDVTVVRGPYPGFTNYWVSPQQTAAAHAITLPLKKRH